MRPQGASASSSQRAFEDFGVPNLASDPQALLAQPEALFGPAAFLDEPRLYGHATTTYPRPYERCWLEAEEGERFAFDWVFPPTGGDSYEDVWSLFGDAWRPF